MKLGIVLSSNDPEAAWNAMRFANTAAKGGHEASVFLMGKGVEIESLGNGKYDINSQISSFLSSGGKILACGTCMKSRGIEGACEISTMKRLLEIVEASDKIVSF